MRKNILATLGTQLPVKLTKAEVIRALVSNLQQASFDADDDVVYVADTVQSKDNVTVECTDGSIIELTVKVR